MRDVGNSHMCFSASRSTESALAMENSFSIWWLLPLCTVHPIHIHFLPYLMADASSSIQSRSPFPFLSYIGPFLLILLPPPSVIYITSQVPSPYIYRIKAVLVRMFYWFVSSVSLRRAGLVALTISCGFYEQHCSKLAPFNETAEIIWKVLHS